MNSRTGAIAAFLHSSFKSEPDNLSVNVANLSMLNSGSVLVSFKIYIKYDDNDIE